MTEPVRVHARDSGDDQVGLLALEGALDITNFERTRAQLLTSLRPQHRHLVLDLSLLSFCDSSGLRVLLATRALIEDRGGVLSLAAVQPRLARVLQITGIEQYFALQPTAEQAVQALTTGAGPTS